jgi:hypothetical protein
MAQITLFLPDDLVERLAPFQDRLPELLERGLRDALRETSRSGSIRQEATEELDASLSRSSDALKDLSHQALARIRSRHRKNPLDFGMPDSTELIREDRELLVSR